MVLIYFIIIACLCYIPQMIVKSKYKKYKSIPNSSGMTGAQMAQELLNRKGIQGVAVTCIGDVESSYDGKSRKTQNSEELSDYYDPSERAICLSREVYNVPSVAAIAIAAHETGHAVQHAEADAFFSVRSAIFPIASFCAQWWIIPFIIGGLLEIGGLCTIAAFLYIGTIIFQLITLPVEFGASARAREMMYANGLMNSQDEKGVKSVLSAAAFTYVAAAMASIIYFLVHFRKR
ncbi:MAG: zinc metallopeptidase [bacterium]|nr:zinc metallopeptidase [bacterium]